MEDLRPYLTPTAYLDSDHPAVARLAQSLTDREATPENKASRLFYYVRDNCRYSMYTVSVRPENYRASYVLEAGEGFCVQKAILLAALSRAAGIPSRLVFASIRNHKAPPEAVEALGTNVFFPHAYTELYLGNRWVKAAPTFDIDSCRTAGVAPVEFDGTGDAVLPSVDLQGNPFIEYLESHGHHQDLPLEWVLHSFRDFYGEKSKEWLAAPGEGS